MFWFCWLIGFFVCLWLFRASVVLGFFVVVLGFAFLFAWFLFVSVCVWLGFVCFGFFFN